MTTSTRAASAVPGIQPTGVATPNAAQPAARRRRIALRVTAGITVGCAALLVILLANRHTTGEEIWGPIVAGSAVLVGALSLVYLGTSRRSRVARVGLIVAWLAIAFLGYGGYNDHRLPLPADAITDQRERPPLAPLMFTAWGIAGAIALHVGSKPARPEGA